jgi:hypothetical protein
VNGDVIQSESVVGLFRSAELHESVVSIRSYPRGSDGRPRRFCVDAHFLEGAVEEVAELN